MAPHRPLAPCRHVVRHWCPHVILIEDVVHAVRRVVKGAVWIVHAARAIHDVELRHTRQRRSALVITRPAGRPLAVGLEALHRRGSAKAHETERRDREQSSAREGLGAKLWACCHWTVRTCAEPAAAGSSQLSTWS
eukprot:2926744-Prymnesium_polylepis.2